MFTTLDQRKQAKMLWLQDPNQSNVDNLENVRCEDGRHVGNKKKEYLKAKIDELETNNGNKNPTDATVCRYLFTAKLLYMFRVSQHPSSGVLKTVTAASGIGHNVGKTTSLQVPIRPRWREVAAPVLWPVPEATVTVFSTPDDGCHDTRNM